MKLITIRSQILEVADVWRSTAAYRTGKHIGSDVEKIEERLNALDKDKATVAEVEEITGCSASDSWVGRPTCEECGEGCDAVVELGEESYYESRTAAICKVCLEKALGLLS